MAKGKKSRGEPNASNQGNKRKQDVSDEDGPDKLQKTGRAYATETTTDSDSCFSGTTITGTSRCSSIPSLSHYSSTSNVTQIHQNAGAANTPSITTEAEEPEIADDWTVKGKRKSRARMHPAARPVQLPPNPETDIITVLFRPVQAEQSLHTLRPSSLCQFYKTLPFQPTHQRKIRRGGFAADFPLETPIDVLTSIKQIADIQVTATLPSSSKRASGCIRGDFPDDEDLLEAYNMRDSNPPASSISRLGRGQVYRIDFKNDCLPANVKIAFSNYRLQPYFFAPTRCFNCHRYNHKAGDCRGKTTCGYCGELGHRFRDCPKTDEPPRCANCAGNHPVTDKSCTHRTYEVQVKKMQAKENIPTYQARAALSMSYAGALKSSTSKNRNSHESTTKTTSTASQTDPEEPDTVTEVSEEHPPNIQAAKKKATADAVPIGNPCSQTDQDLLQEIRSLVVRFRTGSLSLADFTPKLLQAAMPDFENQSPENSTALPSPSKRISGYINAFFQDGEDLLELYNKHHRNPPALSITRCGQSEYYRIDFVSDRIPWTIHIGRKPYLVQTGS